MTRRYWYVILTYIIVQFSGEVGAMLFENIFSIPLIDALVYWLVFSFAVGTAITLYLVWPEFKMESTRDAATGSGILKWAIGGLFMAYFAQYVAALIQIFVLGIDAGSENTMAIMEVARAAPIFILLPAIFAPVLEEIIFRKIIFGSLYKRMNFFLAGLLSALIFGFIHGEPQNILLYASMGYVFAYLYVKTKRIIVPIIVHAAMNTITVIVQYSIDPEELRRQLEQLNMILFGS